MDKQNLIKHLIESREKILEILEGISDEHMVQQGVENDWSVKDLLAHITLWEAQIITLLFQAKSRRKPTTVHFSGRSTDDINDRWFEQYQDRPLEKVWSDFLGIRNQTIRQVEKYSDQELKDPNKFKWLDNEPLSKWIAEETYEHETEHAEKIRRWRRDKGL